VTLAEVVVESNIGTFRARAASPKKNSCQNAAARGLIAIELDRLMATELRYTNRDSQFEDPKGDILRSNFRTVLHRHKWPLMTMRDHLSFAPPGVIGKTALLHHLRHLAAPVRIH